MTTKALIKKLRENQLTTADPEQISAVCSEAADKLEQYEKSESTRNNECAYLDKETNRCMALTAKSCAGCNFFKTKFQAACGLGDARAYNEKHNIVYPRHD
jgi:hypothetical protein